MKKQYLLPFALTAGFAALSGCGGESANVIPEPKSVVYQNGSCVSGQNCVEFALDYPVDGLNFTCSSDRDNVFITLIEAKSNAATGKCTEGDQIHFFLRGDKGVKTVDFGTVALSDIGVVSTVSASLPRLSILDMAKGLTGKAAQSLDASDPTVQVAMALVKIFQAVGMEANQRVAGDVQPIYLLPPKMDKLEEILSSITVADYQSGAYINKIKPWTDAGSITDAEALEALKMLVNMSNSATYQAGYPIFGTGTSTLPVPQGLYGCNKSDCKSADADLSHMIGQYLILTDRQGYTFGYGVQWKGKVSTTSESQILGVSAELLKKARPDRMVATEQTSWVNPLTRSITGPFRFAVSDISSEDFMITQGKVYNDYMIAGTENFYKLLTKYDKGKPEEYGLWKQTLGTDQYRGSFDAYKYFPVGHLDNRVFKSVKNVASGEKYVFPIYATIEFKFTDTSKANVKLPVVLDQFGNVRTDFTSDTDWTPACSPVTEQSSQYRIGVLGATDTDNKAVTTRLILANPVFKEIDGAVIGMNTEILTGTSSSADVLVIGGARVNVEQLLSGAGRFISMTDFSGGTVAWTNIYNSMMMIYTGQTGNNPSDADKELAKNTGGTIGAIEVSSCYQSGQVKP
ncbi:flagellar protein FilF [Acinetobacter chinensis]|uniref:Flagellar protein FilF n=1 Tax=Acinetobacter chinensis TaxID=2004650 RepID=A0ABU3WAG6_9GAMM|nr:flagellar protein FilF [Acinetobacter chinensis]MDV2467387.1 flagellar protein FilF [Acinetobacter chinensis]